MTNCSRSTRRMTSSGSTSTAKSKVKKLCLVARTGHTTAARECFDRMDGKVTLGVDATGQVRRDITVTWVRPAY